MIFKNKRGIGETILIAFMTLLLLLGLYSFFVYHLQIQLLLVIMVVAEAGLLYFYFFGTQYELTEGNLSGTSGSPMIRSAATGSAAAVWGGSGGSTICI